MNTDDTLNQLIEEPNPVGRPAGTANPDAKKWPSGAAMGVQKISYTHAAMIDMIISNPCISQNQLAAHFGYTAGWISQVLSSDAFQVQLAERNKTLVDPVIQASVEARFKGLVMRSLAILEEKLNLPVHQIPDQLVLKTAEIASRAAGYGARSEPAPATNVHLHLEDLGQNLVKLLSRKKTEALEGNFSEITNDSEE